MKENILAVKVNFEQEIKVFMNEAVAIRGDIKEIQNELT